MPYREPLAEDRYFIQQARCTIYPDLTGRRPEGVPSLDDLDLDEADYLSHHGYALMMCGDCDFSVGSIEHLVDCFGTKRIHMHSMDGGAILLDETSPPNITGSNCANVLRERIYRTFELKRFRHLFLDGHIPCGAAYADRMSARDVVVSLMRAKDFLIAGKDRPARLEKIPMLLRYWDGGKLRTYQFKRRYMRQFLQVYKPLRPETVPA